MKTRCRAGVAGLLLGLAWGAMAAPADDAAARARLRDEQVALQARLDERERGCIDRSAPRTCVDAARRAHRAALAPLRREQGALDAAQRRRESLQRAATHAAPASAQLERTQRAERSRQAFEARQRAAQEHRDAAAQRQAIAASAGKPRKPAAPLPVPAGAAPR